MHLDTRTLVIVATFVALAPAAIGVLVWHTRPTCPGFGCWTLGNISATIALFLISLRGVAPDWISVVLANVFAVGAAILFFQGIRLFCRLRLYWWPESLAGVLVISAVIYFRYFTNDIDVRILVMSLLTGSIGLACGITLLRAAPSGSRFSMFFTGMVFTLAGAVSFFRGIYVYTYGPVTDLFAPSAANAAFFGGTSLAVLCWSFGFILMTGEGQAMVRVESMCRAGAGKTVTEAEIRQQVQLIVMSDGFRRSARMERFLRVAVERTLLGRTEDLKEYALGRDVFNRGEQYDPRDDSIVRVEAQRLRRKLREYYDSCGKNDPIVVEFHAGSYVPVFRYATPTEMRLTMSKPATGTSNG
jgi:hypothetical protein